MRNRAAEFLALISVAARSRTHAQCSALSHTTIVNLNTWENSLEEELRTRAGTIQDASEEEIAEGRARKSRHRSFCAGRPGIEKEKRKLSFAWFSQRELPFRHLAAFFPLFLSFIHVHTHTHAHILNSVPCPLHLPFFLAGWFRLRPPFSRLDSAPLISPFAVSSPPSPSLLFHWPHQHTY